MKAHAIEGGTFVLNACAYQDPSTIPNQFPHKDQVKDLSKKSFTKAADEYAVDESRVAETAQSIEQKLSSL